MANSINSPVNHTQSSPFLNLLLLFSTWVPIEPVEPIIDIGFGTSQLQRPCSGIALPGQAGGSGSCTEQWTRLQIMYIFYMNAYVSMYSKINII